VFRFWGGRVSHLLFSFSLHLLLFEALFLAIAQGWAIKLASVKAWFEIRHGDFLFKYIPAMGEVLGKPVEHRIEITLTEGNLNAVSDSPPSGGASRVLVTHILITLFLD